jgi:light-regulated signal transduction histidine kinase (bacteriophytochrome)
LHVLIHDIRTPVGVAQGYLRLLREDRLTTPDERLRAITQAQQALERVARLCTDAAALADTPLRATTVTMPCERFIGRVRQRLEREPVELAPASLAAGAALAVPADSDALADAVTRVLLASPPDRADRRRSVTIGATDTELWFTSGATPQPLSGEALDPWTGPGFALPLACRAIADAGGRVWAGRDPVGTGVALPLEVTR